MPAVAASEDLQRWVVIMGSVVTIVTIIAGVVNGYIAYLAAQKVDVVKDVLATSTTKTDVKLDVIHKTVNSYLTAQLKSNAERARRIEGYSKGQTGHESDLAEAIAAEKLYLDHLHPKEKA